MQVAYGVLAASCACPVLLIGVIVNEAWELEWIKVAALLAARTPRNHVTPRQGRTASGAIALSY